MDIRKRILIYLWTQSHSDHKVTVKELSDLLVKEGYLKEQPQSYDATLNDVLKAAMRRKDIEIEGISLDEKDIPSHMHVRLKW